LSRTGQGASSNWFAGPLRLLTGAGVIGLFHILFPSYAVAEITSPLFSIGGILNYRAISLLGLGMGLGLKHALDADHLLAVATIVSEHKSLRNALLVGVSWGLGHTAALIIVGFLIISWNIHIPETLALGIEFIVALIIVGLGVNVLRKLRRGAFFHIHTHRHNNHLHIHPHIHDGSVNTHSHLLPAQDSQHQHHNVTIGKKPFVVGMAHGMAGSSALMLIVLATIPSRALALCYIGVFGLGAVGGMLMMSALIGIPFVFTAKKSELVDAIVRGCSAVVSIAFGLLLAWQIGFADGLFL